MANKLDFTDFCTSFSIKLENSIKSAYSGCELDFEEACGENEEPIKIIYVSFAEVPQIKAYFKLNEVYEKNYVAKDLEIDDIIEGLVELINPKNTLDFSRAKPKSIAESFRLRLINIKKNKNFLKTVPYLMCGIDIAVFVKYSYFENNGISDFSNLSFNDFDFSKEEIFELAIENTENLGDYELMFKNSGLSAYYMYSKEFADAGSWIFCPGLVTEVLYKVGNFIAVPFYPSLVMIVPVTKIINSADGHLDKAADAIRKIENLLNTETGGYLSEYLLYFCKDKFPLRVITANSPDDPELTPYEISVDDIIKNNS